jgi:hypothetical protein
MGGDERLGVVIIRGHTKAQIPGRCCARRPYRDAHREYDCGDSIIVSPFSLEGIFETCFARAPLQWFWLLRRRLPPNLLAL